MQPKANALVVFLNLQVENLSEQGRRFLCSDLKIETEAAQVCFLTSVFFVEKEL